ncbi:DUF3124 domain-containing protein [Desulfovibrio oxyclinae]|jgi:hypothetical protein|uniref:DUF3124 domain-containing protein n=1 Tax=Desulfovibrio oxyclinae TaxID=63560 RepID=UPI0003809658|nr:DUF3124 domain-containing protein [Desulfovibrio oxyclinae]
MKILRAAMLLPVLWIAAAIPASAEEAPRVEQSVYVPAYSHVYQGPKSRIFDLAILLSIRNVDRSTPITISLVEYYDDHGNKVRDFLEEPIVLQPLETFEVKIPEKNTDGGSGANFIVDWEAAHRITEPIIQAVMIGAASQQGISFVCDGVPLED